MDSHSDSIRSYWSLCGTDIPKAEVVFFTQVVLIYIVVLTSIVNLTLGNEYSNLWVALLSANIGYLLPNPSLKQNGQKLLSNTTKQHKVSEGKESDI